MYKVQDIAQILYQDNQTQMLEALTACLDLSCENERVVKLVNYRLLPYFLRLSNQHWPEVQIIACKILYNILLSDIMNLNIIINMGAIPIFLQLVQSSEEVVIEYGLHFISMILDLGVKARDFLIINGVLPHITNNICTARPPILLQLSSDILRKFFMYSCAQLPHGCVEMVIEPIAYLLHQSEQEILCCTCLTIKNILDSCQGAFKIFKNTEIFDTLIDLLTVEHIRVILNILDILKEVINLDDTFCNTLLNSENFRNLFDSEDHSVKDKATELLQLLSKNI